MKRKLCWLEEEITQVDLTQCSDVDLAARLWEEARSEVAIELGSKSKKIKAYNGPKYWLGPQFYRPFDVKGNFVENWPMNDIWNNILRFHYIIEWQRMWEMGQIQIFHSYLERDLDIFQTPVDAPWIQRFHYNAYTDHGMFQHWNAFLQEVKSIKETIDLKAGTMQQLTYYSKSSEKVNTWVSWMGKFN